MKKKKFHKKEKSIISEGPFYFDGSSENGTSGTSMIENRTSGENGTNIPYLIDTDEKNDFDEIQINLIKKALSLSKKQLEYLYKYLDVYYNYNWFDYDKKKAEEDFKKEFFKRKNNK